MLSSYAFLERALVAEPSAPVAEAASGPWASEMSLATLSAARLAFCLLLVAL